MILLKDQTSAELAAALSDLAPPDRLVRQLHALAVRHNASAVPGELPNMSRLLLQRIRERVTIPRLS